jgi:hypothetical protein
MVRQTVEYVERNTTRVKPPQGVHWGTVEYNGHRSGIDELPKLIVNVILVLGICTAGISNHGVRAAQFFEIPEVAS